MEVRLASGLALWLTAAALLSGCPQAESASAGRGAASGSNAPRASTERPSLPATDPTGCGAGERTAERERMVRETIEADGIKDGRVLAAMRRVARHRFVPDSVSIEAYEDRPLPIVHDQTISQPFIVAFMTAAVAPKPSDKCLEIGTGSGYQAAILAELCRRTYSIEYLPDVARFGEANLRRCGYGRDRVELRVGDGYRGWPEAAPFDVIVVTAAPEQVPTPLLAQLGVGGRLVVPVGSQQGTQQLELWTRAGTGPDASALERRRLLPVRFVPLLGEAQQR